MTLILLWNLPPIGQPDEPMYPMPKPRSRLAYEGRDLTRVTQYPTEWTEDPMSTLDPALIYLALEFLNE